MLWEVWEVIPERHLMMLMLIVEAYQHMPVLVMDVSEMRKQSCRKSEEAQGARVHG